MHAAPTHNRIVDEIRQFKRLWSNGTRPLILATIAAVVSIAMLCSILLYAIWSRPGPYIPLEFKVPQEVHNTGPIYPGNIVFSTGTKCLHADEAIATTTSRWMRNESSREIITLSEERTVARDPGCETRNYETAIPPGLPPGTWRLEGQAVARDGNRTQTEVWYSEWFEVTPRD